MATTAAAKTVKTGPSPALAARSVSSVVRVAPVSTFARIRTSPFFPRIVTSSTTPIVVRLSTFCCGMVSECTRLTPSGGPNEVLRYSINRAVPALDTFFFRLSVPAGPGRNGLR